MKTSPESGPESGNVLFIIFIAIALFAALSYAFSNSTSSNQASRISEDRARILSTALINEAQNAKTTIDTMVQFGADQSDISFLNPASAGYATPPNGYKFYHPAGGGFTYNDSYDEEFYNSAFSDQDGWLNQTQTNVDWTASTDDDIIFTFDNVNQDICQQINEHVTGEETIPVASATIDALFNEGLGGNTDLTTGVCGDCNGYHMLCLEDSNGKYAFYNILLNE